MDTLPPSEQKTTGKNRISASFGQQKSLGTSEKQDTWHSPKSVDIKDVQLI
jgi:hypothetical protein